MRILILHSRYLSGEMSGENRVVSDDAGLLRNAGHEVTVVSPEPQVAALRGRLRTAGQALWARSSARTVGEIIDGWEPDVVHVHNVYPTLSPLVVREAARRVPVILTLHNYRQMCLAGTFLRENHICEACVNRVPWRGVVHGCYRGSRASSTAIAVSMVFHRAAGSYREVGRYLAVSEFVRTKHIEAGLPPERIVVRPNFAWPIARRTGYGDHFLFVGRLSAEKGLHDLLAVWGQMKAELVVVGDGPERPGLQAIAPPNVRFVGYVPSAGVADLLGVARALVVPSAWYEGMPRCVIEAYAAGVPVLATRIGGLAESVRHDVTGLLIAPRDKGGWGAAVEQLLDDGVSKRLGSGAWNAWRDSYSPQAALRTTVGIYRTVAGVNDSGSRRAAREAVGREPAGGIAS